MSKVKESPYWRYYDASHGLKVKYNFKKSKPQPRFTMPMWGWSVIHILIASIILLTMIGCDGGWSVAGYEIPEKIINE